jgi:hypothetical protein
MSLDALLSLFGRRRRRPAPIHLTVVNNGQVPAMDVQAWIVAQQGQITQDLQPAWGVSATIDLLPGGWPVYLLGVTDYPGALGYHDVDTAGKPYAKVFVQTAAANQTAWQIVASHEVLEMLVNPGAASQVTGPDGCEWYREVCDPVEDITYARSGVVLADFVLPSWFEAHGTAPFDFQHLLMAPFHVTAGGYVSEVCAGQAKIVGAAVPRSVDRAYP